MASTDRTAKIRIVCLHGFSCNSAIYRFQTARLRKRWAEHLRQHPLVVAATSASPSSTSSSRAASPGLDDPWQRNNTQYHYDSDEESSSAVTTTSSSSSVDLAASISSRSSISFSSDYPPPPSYSSGSTNGSGNSGSGGVVVYNDVEFIFLESPREVSTPEQPLAEVASLFPGPYRTWFEPSTTSRSTGTPRTTAETAKPDDGRRSRRRDPAVERWVVEQVKRAGGVHGVLAFSDGAALTAALTLKAEAGVAACPKLWDFVVLACGVDPYPDPWLHGNSGSSADIGEAKEEEEEETTAGKCLARLKTPGLHIVGLRDEVYRDRSEALWGLVHPQAVAAAREEKGMNAASGMAAEVYRFDDGHKVPVQDTDLDAILSAWRRVVVRSGLFRDASPDEVVAASRVLAV